MSTQLPDPDDPGAWVQRLEDQCRREAMEIRIRASAEAETSAAEALEAANGLVERRIQRLRELRSELATASGRIERDMARAATEIRRRAERPGDGESASPASAVTYPPKT